METACGPPRAHPGRVRVLGPAVLVVAGCGEFLAGPDNECTVRVCDDSPVATLVRWQFETFAGAPVPCPAGAELVEVTVMASGGLDRETAESACSAGEIWFDTPFSPASYSATVTSADRAATYATTFHAPPLTPRPGLPGILLAIIVDGGYLDLEWTFTNSCQPPGEIVVIATPVGGGAPIEARRDCVFGQARVPLPAGEYDLAFTGSDTLGTGTAPGPRVTVEAPNKLSAPIEFQIVR